MANESYVLPESPVYNESIRKLRNTDPANAETVFNPLIQALVNNIHFVKKGFDNAVSVTAVSVEIPLSAWTESESGAEYPYYARVESAGITEEQYPDVTLNLNSGDAAFSCGLSPLVQTEDGALLFYSEEVPETALYGVCRLIKNGLSPGGGAENISVSLNVDEYTGTSGVTAYLNGVAYDADNISTDPETASDGTIIIKEIDGTESARA